MRSKFLQFLKQKEIAEHRQIKVSEIMEKTGLSRNTIKSWLSPDPMKYVASEVVVVLAAYVNQDWHELLEPIEISENET